MRRYLITFVIALLALAGFLTFASPDNLPIGILIFPIILIFLLIYLLVIIICGLWNKQLLGSRRVKVVAVLLGAVSALFLLFQSSGGVSWSDTTLILLILVVAYFYSSKI